MAWMYILRCNDGTYYVGSTTDLSLRLAEHEQGIGARYTSARLPVQLVFSCEFQGIVEAYERENQVKHWSKVKKEALIREQWNELPELSKRRTPNVT